jgi:hypothetical protein
MERKRMLRRLRVLIGWENYKMTLRVDGENALFTLARSFFGGTPYQRFDYFSSGVTSGEEYEKLFILDRMRSQIGWQGYEKQLDRLGEDGLTEVGFQMVERAISASKRPVRTREASSKVNLITLLVALAMGAYLGAVYPDESALAGMND